MTLKSGKGLKTGKGRGSQDPAPEQAIDVPTVVQANFTSAAGESHGQQPSVPSSYVAYTGNAALVRLKQAVDPNVTDRKLDGSPYLIDACPDIHARTKKDELLPNVPWQLLKDNKTVEWRCWTFVRRWRNFANYLMRKRLKKRLFAYIGHLLDCRKDRLRGKVHYLDRDFPPELFERRRE